MTLPDAILDEVQDLLYTQNYAFNHRYGHPEYETLLKQSNLRMLEIMTQGAYPVKPAGPANPVDTSPPTPTAPVTPPTTSGISVGTLKTPTWAFPAGGTMPAVIARFTPSEFRAYVQWVRKNEKYSWTPTGITGHHTAVPNPSYEKWRDGWTAQLLTNARSGYIKDRGWNAAPHIYTDQNGIWVLNPLSLRGTHAACCNSNRYGVEMLINGDDKAQVDSPIGQANIRMGKIAIAILMKDAGIPKNKLNFHRDDPATTKTCPGKYIEFKPFEIDVAAIYDSIV